MDGPNPLPGPPFTLGYQQTNGTAGDWLASTTYSTYLTPAFEIDGSLVGDESSTPEPRAWLLIAGGLVAITLFGRRRYTPRPVHH